jgi:predicted esterase
MRRPIPWLAIVVLLGLAGGAAFAKGKPPPAKPAEWGEENGTQTVAVTEPTPLKAYVHVPSGLEEGKKVGLVIVLHGHGGTPTGMLGYGRPIGDARKEIWMACQGGTPIDAGGQPGFQWELKDKDGVLACLDACLAKHPVDPRRVVLMGFSAGGRMAFETHATRPGAFAGIYACSSAAGPSSAQKGVRVVMSFGTKDPNYASLFQPSRQAAEKTTIGRCVSIADGEHNDLPDPAYSIDALAWILESKAPSETLTLLPRQPGDEARTQSDWPGAKSKGGAYRHVLLFEAGGRGAPPDAPAKAAAQALAADLKKQPPDADWNAVVAAKSQDPLSKDSGGVVTGAVLARYGGALLEAMKKLKPGETSAAVQSDAGWHVLRRDPAD